MVEVADFRAAMRLIVGNVSVITAGVGDDRSGLVVISVVSLSAEPPKVIACVNRSSSTWPVIERYRHFGVNSLGPQHQRVAERFSGFGGIKGKDRYEGAEWMTLKTGASLLSDAVAAFGSIRAHLDVVEAAAPRGIHVMVEKPLEIGRAHV